MIGKASAIAVAIGLLSSGSAIAQQTDVTAAVVQSRRAYVDCVYESVAAQLKQMPNAARQNVDMSYLGEQGFLACATEERALAMILVINHMPPQAIQAAMLGVRVQIKRTLHQIAANPKDFSK